MPLSRLSVENYRCFAESQVVELRPITVLIGRNNAGKSAFARAALLLESAVRTDGPEPIVLGASVGKGRARNFVDLVHGNRIHGSIRLGFTVDDPGRPPVEVDVTIQNISEERSQLVSQLTVKAGATECKLEWFPDESVGGQRPYVMNDSSAQDAFYVDFAGILPKSLPPTLTEEAYRVAVEDAFGRIRASLDHTRYLGPFRMEPEPFYEYP